MLVIGFVNSELVLHGINSLFDLFQDLAYEMFSIKIILNASLPLSAGISIGTDRSCSLNWVLNLLLTLVEFLLNLLQNDYLNRQVFSLLLISNAFMA